MRFFSVILFVAMVAVLPTAGLQQYFCTLNMEFVDGANDCPATEKDCCEKTHKSEPANPDCMVAAKSLPSAENSVPLKIPAADAMWTMLPIVLIDLSPITGAEFISPEKDRGPPDESRLFITQRRLLI